MAIIVCIKQVPVDIHDVLTERDEINRENGVYGINPADLYALEAALRLKEILNEKVIAISMGTKRCVETLREVIAIGADEAVLLNDNRFAGSDTQATSYILYKAICRMKNVSAVFCGKQSVDGDTGQVGPELAEKLGFPFSTNVMQFSYVGNRKIEYTRLLDKGMVTGRAGLPILFTVNRMIGECRVATIKGLLKAENTTITVWNLEDIGADYLKCGIQGSMTTVKNIQNVDIRKSRTVELKGNNHELAQKLIEMIQQSAPYEEALRKTETEKFNGTYYIEKKTVRECGKEKGKLEVCIFAELIAGEIENSVFQMIGKMRGEVGNSAIISVIILSEILPDNIADAFYYGADQIYFFREEVVADGNEEYYGDIIIQLLENKKVDILLFSSTEFSRALASWIASKIGVGLTADCVDLKMNLETGILTEVRPAFSGNRRVEIICKKGNVQMATVRPNVFPILEGRETSLGKVAEVYDYQRKGEKKKYKVVKNSENDLEKYPVSFIGGRGVRSREKFEQMKKIAGELNAGTGATRAAVDAGWTDYQRQVGLTGTSVHSKACVLFGVSGASEHVAGITNVSTIIAVNLDENAEIFKYSDIKIVADAGILLDEMEKIIETKEN